MESGNFWQGTWPLLSLAVPVPCLPQVWRAFQHRSPCVLCQEAQKSPWLSFKSVLLISNWCLLEMPHKARLLKQHRPCCPQHLQHLESFRATQKSCASCMFQLVLKFPLHLSCGHVFGVPHFALVQGTSAPLLGPPVSLKGDPWHEASSQCLDTWIKPPTFAASVDLCSLRCRFQNVVSHLQHC